jgi:glycosyltransferase involved in cell wall biosynthesis
MNAAYAWLALETERPVIASVHGNDFLRPYILTERWDLGQIPALWRFKRLLKKIDQRLGQLLTTRILRKSLPLVDYILANSLYTESALLQHYPACAGRTVAAMVGVSDFFFEEPLPDRSSHNKKQLVTLCRLSEPRKNVGLVIECLARLKEKYDFHYTIIGDGPLKPKLLELAADVGLSNRVTFTGYLSNESIREYLRNSDLFVLTSSITPKSHEGFGIVYLEANACGTPVLAARLAGAAEAVDEGKSGYFVDQPNTDAVENALTLFLEGQITFEPKECRTFAEGFTWKRVVDQGVAAYDAALEH